MLSKHRRLDGKSLFLLTILIYPQQASTLPLTWLTPPYPSSPSIRLRADPSRKLNTNPKDIADPDILKLPLTTPPIKKIDLVWPTGLSITARNMKGVTIKDALEAIYKQFKKKADDELGDKPYLAGFEWDREEVCPVTTKHFDRGCDRH